MIRLLLLIAALFTGTNAIAQYQRSDGETFLQAVRSQDAATAIPFLEQPGSRYANFTGYSGEGAIHIVTRSKSLPWLATLLKFGADTNLADRNGETALLIATELGWQDGAERLVRAGAHVDQANRKGETPLIRAVLLRKPLLVKLYMKSGADPDRADYAAGRSARDYAASDRRNRELIELIEETSENRELDFGPVVTFPTTKNESGD